MTTAHGVRAIAAETGLESWKIAFLARDGYAQIIFQLVMVEQRHRRLAATGPTSIALSPPTVKSL